LLTYPVHVVAVDFAIVDEFRLEAKYEGSSED
jgi:hypothetical protein